MRVRLRCGWVRLRGTAVPGNRFYREDLKEQEISLYRTSDGRRLLLASSPEVALSAQSFALAPSGRYLATVVGETVRLYAAP